MRSDAVCKSCKARIRWAVTETGRRMPLDPVGVADGNVWVLRFEGGTPIVAVARKPDDVPSSEPTRYRSHFSTCPEAASWRKR